MKPGHCFTIEPMISEGNGQIYLPTVSVSKLLHLTQETNTT
jgi:methionine aminopeptidase